MLCVRRFGVGVNGVLQMRCVGERGDFSQCCRLKVATDVSSTGYADMSHAEVEAFAICFVDALFLFGYRRLKRKRGLFDSFQSVASCRSPRNGRSALSCPRQPVA